MNGTLLAKFKSSWSFNRQLTLDLISALSDNDLLFSPSPALGPFWKQFRHVGRVQECYMDALNTGKIVFAAEMGSYSGGPHGQGLADYLRELDQNMNNLLAEVDPSSTIDWEEESVDIAEHLLRMDSHEVLHHGQCILYMRLAGKQFPASWAVWGL